MSSNKNVKRKLIKKFGEMCFLEELGIRDKEEVKKEIAKYTGKKQRQIMDTITYHHILEKCKGGQSTEENGVLLRNINHIWFNRLSKEQQAVLNKLFQEYKRTHLQECKVEYVDKLDLGYKITAFIFNTKDLESKREYNRAKAKEEFKKQIKEWEEER